MTNIPVHFLFPRAHLTNSGQPDFQIDKCNVSTRKSPNLTLRHRQLTATTAAQRTSRPMPEHPAYASGGDTKSAIIRVKSEISECTLAFSRACMYSFLLLTGTIVHGYPPACKQPVEMRTRKLLRTFQYNMRILLLKLSQLFKGSSKKLLDICHNTLFIWKYLMRSSPCYSFLLTGCYSFLLTIG